MLIARRSALLAAIALLSLFFVTSTLEAAPQGKDGMEEFEEQDPYTKGKSELVEALGYKRMGHMMWHSGEDTKAVQMNMGGIDMLFVETEHFKIASSLGTYKIPNDKEERTKIKAELKRLKKKLGRLKAPKNALDPWLRLHVYAQRAEDQYAAFCDEFDLSPADFEKTGPNLGYPNKTLLVLCQRKSEFGRYIRTYHDSSIEYGFRTIQTNDAMTVAVNQEALTEGREREQEMPADAMLHNVLVSMLSSIFVDAYQGNMFSAPRWFVYGLAHEHVRAIAPHLPQFDGRKSGTGGDADHWDWEPRVYKLVKNKFFAKATEMFAWKEYTDLHERDHMVSWSKVMFLMNEIEGDQKAFLGAICSKSGGLPAGEVDDRLVARQVEALKQHFGLTPEEFDAAWAKWVKKTYRKK